jgi:3-methylcrotonyl-CoA carboxylase alpha subunit
MTEALRAAMTNAAVAAAKAVGYVGAGTVEFIVEGDKLDPSRFFFMEMNTRLQVEHPVTEAITGLDLVEWQFRVASGEPLPRTQNEIRATGHAVEARLYAEDPEHGFLPSSGTLWALDMPEGDGVRVDTGVAAGDEITAFYDPMIAKIIAQGATRADALDRLARALRATRIAGPRSNLAFLIALAEAKDFRAGHFDTGFIEANLAALGAVEQQPDSSAIEAGARFLFARLAAASVSAGFDDPWQRPDGFSLGGPREIRCKFVADGQIVELGLDRDIVATRAKPAQDGIVIVVPDDGRDRIFVLRDGRQTEVGLYDSLAREAESGEAGGNVVTAPMHGKLVALLVRLGDRVAKGQRLAIIEAMKMEHALVAPSAGSVAEIAASVGAQVARGVKIVVIHA